MRVICTDCNWIGDEAAMLHAPNPFEPGDELTGCPECKAINMMTSCCDEPGCNERGSCGWPTKDGGYRRTCYTHWQQ